MQSGCFAVGGSAFADHTAGLSWASLSQPSAFLEIGRGLRAPCGRERAGFRVVRRELVRMAELGVTGAHPSSRGMTGLWQIEKAGPVHAPGDSTGPQHTCTLATP